MLILGSWKISYAIKNLEPEIESKHELTIDNVFFRMREKQVVGTVLITDDNEENAILEARQRIDRAVSKLCYIYHKEVSMITNGIYIVNLAVPSVETVRGEFVFMHDIGMDALEESAFSKLKNLDPNKQEIIHKALGLYRVGQGSSDPFKAIDSYFGCIHALLKDQSNPISPESDLKKGLKLILQKRIENFDEQDFYNKFGRYYGKWRSGSTHGELDISDHNLKSQAYMDSKEAKSWAREVLDEYLTVNKK
jgi:hypothetical protein